MGCVSFYDDGEVKTRKKRGGARFLQCAVAPKAQLPVPQRDVLLPSFLLLLPFARYTFGCFPIEDSAAGSSSRHPCQIPRTRHSLDPMAYYTYTCERNRQRPVYASVFFGGGRAATLENLETIIDLSLSVRSFGVAFISRRNMLKVATSC